MSKNIFPIVKKKTLTKTNNIYSKTEKSLNIRKPINKIMNLDNFLNRGRLSTSPKTDLKFSFYSSKKSYISPKISFQNINSIKKVNSNNISPSNKVFSTYFNISKNKNTSPNQKCSIISLTRHKNIINKSIKNNLYSTKKNNNNSPKNTFSQIPQKKYSFKPKNKKDTINMDINKNSKNNNKSNYKDKVINKKGMLPKNIGSHKIINILIDINNSVSSANNSIKGKEKIKQYINKNKKNINKNNNNNIDKLKNKEELNILLTSNESDKKDKNSNNKNKLVYSVGSIIRISENNSSLLKEKIEEKNKNKNKNNNNNKKFCINL